MEQNLNGHNEKSLLRVDMQPSSRYIWTLKTEVCCCSCAVHISEILAHTDRCTSTAADGHVLHEAQQSQSAYDGIFSQLVSRIRSIDHFQHVINFY